jgi:GNAT superfamily N-acetyltransferase
MSNSTLARQRMFPDAPQAHIIDDIEFMALPVDRYSDLRALHVRAFRAALGNAPRSDAEAFRDFVYNPAYIDQLAKADVIAAIYDHQLVGTAASVAMPDQPTTARVWAVYVAPELVGYGIGSKLLSVIEQRARARGYKAFSVRAKGPSIQFFERNDYTVQSQGAAQPMIPGGDGPTTFLRKPRPAPQLATSSSGRGVK